MPERPIDQAMLDHYYDPYELTVPVERMDGKTYGVLAQHSDFQYAVELPASTTGDTVQVREVPDSEGASVGVLLDGRWYARRADIYVRRSCQEKGTDDRR